MMIDTFLVYRSFGSDETGTIALTTLQIDGIYKIIKTNAKLVAKRRGPVWYTTDMDTYSIIIGVMSNQFLVNSTAIICDTGLVTISAFAL